MKRHRDAASGEIAELKKSVEILSPGTVVPLRVRRALRYHDCTRRAHFFVALIYGAIAGTWLPMPIALAFDTKEGSIRSVLGHFRTEASSLFRVGDSVALATGAMRLGWGLVALLVFYLFMAIGPLVIGVRVGNGYPGLNIPGRKTILAHRHSFIVSTCGSAVSACAKVIGTTGGRRTVQLQKAADSVQSVRMLIRILPRFEEGPWRGRRQRRRRTAQHIKKVSVVLAEVEMQLGDASDQQVREAAGKLLQIAERVANLRHQTLIDPRKLRNVSIPEREPLRFAMGAVLTLVLSGASIAVIGFMGLPGVLEPIAITASITVSTVIVFRGKAMEKLESFGILKGGSSSRDAG